MINEIDKILSDLIAKKSLATYRNEQVFVVKSDQDLATSSFRKAIGDFVPAFEKINSSPFLAQMKTEDTIELPHDLEAKMNEIVSDLKFETELHKNVERLLQKLYVENSHKDIKVSRSKDNEFLIYIFAGGTYKNVLINEDGDIELLVIPADKTKSHNKTFFKEDGLNFSRVVSAFNEMH